MRKRERVIYNGMVEVKMSKKDWALEDFKSNLDPNLDKADRVKLILEYMHRRDEDAVQAMRASRVDSDERRMAFVEALMDAIQTDKESIERKATDILWAIETNNAERLLIGLCGWGANSLAKRAKIIPDDGLDFFSHKDEAKLIVRWSDGELSECHCVINPYTFEILEFDDEVFMVYADKETVEDVFVAVHSETSNNQYYFACITAEERDRTGDELSYWYSLERDEED